MALKVTVHTLVPSSSTLMLTPHSRAFGGMLSCARSPPSRPPRVLARPFFRDRPAMASSSSSEDEEAMLLSSCERPSTSCTRARAPRRAPRMCGTQEGRQSERTNVEKWKLPEYPYCAALVNVVHSGVSRAEPFYKTKTQIDTRDRSLPCTLLTHNTRSTLFFSMLQCSSTTVTNGRRAGAEDRSLVRLA